MIQSSLAAQPTVLFALCVVKQTTNKHCRAETTHGRTQTLISGVLPRWLRCTGADWSTDLRAAVEITVTLGAGVDLRRQRGNNRMEGRRQEGLKKAKEMKGGAKSIRLASWLPVATGEARQDRGASQGTTVTSSTCWFCRAFWLCYFLLFLIPL